MPKKRRTSGSAKQVIAGVLAIFGFVSLLGELGITSIGEKAYALLKYPLGEKAWLGPLIFFLLALVTWVSSSFQTKRRNAKMGKVRSKGSSRQLGKSKQKEKFEQVSRQEPRSIKKAVHKNTDGIDSANSVATGITLPKAKLVNLKGFNEYFSTPEGPEIEKFAPMEELKDVGNDFPTYFKEGNELSFKPLVRSSRLAPVRGFPSYFDEVSAEIEEEVKKFARPDAGRLFPPKREWETPSFLDKSDTRSTTFPGQVSQLIKLERRASLGVSPEERAELLGKTMDELQEAEAISTKALVGMPMITKMTDESTKIMTMGAEAEVVIPTDVLDIEETIKPLEDIENTLVDAIETITTKDATERITLVDATERITTKDENGSAENSLCAEIPKMDDCVKDTSIKESQIKNLDKPVSWRLPGVELLDALPQVPLIYDSETQKHLERVLEDFGVQAKVIRVARGPVITRYELAPAPGVKISRIVNLSDDIALGLAARDVRIEAPIPGKAAIGIEVPNKQPRPVHFREVLETPEYKDSPSKLRIALGKDIANQSVVANLAKMPHMLVAGATGSGKSVCITALINSLLFNARPDEVKFLMVDPKMVELSIYNGIPHLLAPVVTDPKKAAAALKWVVKEMETRYELFAAAGVRDIERYNRMKALEVGAEQTELAPHLPWIVVIIDELADLMMVAADEVEEAICRLAQMARAAGIHLVIATQRPSVDVITGVIKANIPSRISFAVSSQIDSRTILDAAGAEKLLGRGDMLYSPQGVNKPVRVQGCMVSDDEVQRVISFWKAQGRPEYLDPEGFTTAASSGKGEGMGIDDELFVDAGRLVITMGVASVSYLQRKLKIGYARAARLMDLLEDNSIVGGYEGSKARQILLTIDEFEERFG